MVLPGYGRLTSPELEYEGLWVHDRSHGQGYLKTRDSTYVGGFHKGFKQGPSCYEMWFDENRATYAGSYHGGNRHGYGELLTAAWRGSARRR